MLIGLLAGEAMVIYLMFTDTTPVGNVNVGIVGRG